MILMNCAERTFFITVNVNRENRMEALLCCFCPEKI